MRQKYEQYLREEKAFSERSIKDYLAVWDDIASRLDLLGDNDYKAINDILKELKVVKKWSQGTTYKRSICIRNIFKWLHRERYIQHNPYPFAEWKKPKPKAPKFLTTEAFEALVSDPFLSHQELTLLYMLWDSAGRLSEIVHLEQKHVDLERKTINIPFEISKGNYSHRYVPISDKLTELLYIQFGYVRARGHESCIFLSIMDNAPLSANGVSKIVDKIGLRSSPLRPQMRLSPHQFRHSFGIRMLEKGVPQLIVQKWLGHSTLDQTSTYVNMTVQNSRNIYEQYVG